MDAGERLAALRAELRAQNLDGFLVPLTDAHMSEYVGADARRLEWLTGFSGSAGFAAVLADKAAIFVDGRYTLQARAQVDAALYQHLDIPGDPIPDWLAANAAADARIGYDPWLTNRAQLAQLQAALQGHGAGLVAVGRNPVDAVWATQPAPSLAPAIPYPAELSGESAAAKRQMIAQALGARGGRHVVLSALDSVAWAFNIRGTDIWRTPVVRAFAIIAADASATLFLDPAKVTPELRAHLGAGVAIRPYAEFGAALAALEGPVWIDPQSAVVAISAALQQAGTAIISARDPCVIPKAAKNDVELAGMRAAHVRDGVAMAKFLHEVDHAPPVDELAAAARLEALRREDKHLRDLSFDSISAIDANAALPHYHSTPASNRRFAGAHVYLIDSGGQYEDGTTDITRTVALCPPSAEFADRYTRVLKGHIALATARFPEGTRGGQLDALARQYLWAAGLDYAHGTGHGVGHYLSVHEGPQRIAAAATASGIGEVLLPGMVISNEPGFYADGAYGIRIENLVVVVRDRRPDDVAPMLAFETITLCPIDTRPIVRAQLTEAEIGWLDGYHARVQAALAPQLEGAALQWLLRNCQPLARN